MTLDELALLQKGVAERQSLLDCRAKLVELGHESVQLAAVERARAGFAFAAPAYVLRAVVDGELATIEATLIKLGLEIEPTFKEARKG